MIPWATMAVLLPQIVLVVAVVAGTIWLTLRGRTKLMADAQAEYDSTLEKSKAVWKERAETCEESLEKVRADRDYWKRYAEDADLKAHDMKNKLLEARLKLSLELENKTPPLRNGGRDPRAGQSTSSQSPDGA